MSHIILSLSLLLQILAPRPEVDEALKSVNYDKSRITEITLADPLTFADGRRVRSRKQWPRRREEILEIFQREMYGRMPGRPDTMVVEVAEQDSCLNGFGYRRQMRMWFDRERRGPCINWLVITPTHVQEPVPAVMLLNYHGNQAILPDKEIFICRSWFRDDPEKGIYGHRATEQGRGFYADQHFRTVYPVGDILARGYAFVTACYADVSPDPWERVMQDTLAYTGVFDLWGERDPGRSDNTTSLCAWAWALMRGLDMLREDSMIDGDRIVLTGSSRLGKAALLAAAFDERFPVAVINQTGGGGVPLAKHFYGENILTETTTFTHWYCGAYGEYAGHEDALPFDQHMLVSCIAPRALLVEGFDDPWFDTEGEWLSVKAAERVWKFLGAGGLGCRAWPDDFDTSAIGRRLGYVRRSGPHGHSFIDWKWMLDFADAQFR